MRTQFIWSLGNTKGIPLLACLILIAVSSAICSQKKSLSLSSIERESLLKFFLLETEQKKVFVILESEQSLPVNKECGARIVKPGISMYDASRIIESEY